MKAPGKVPGRGKRYATELWLDARDMSFLNWNPMHKTERMRVVFNEFDEYFSASSNYDYLEPGKHTTLRVKQVQHVASDRFRDLDLLRRQCRFPNENPGLPFMSFNLTIILIHRPCR